MMEKYKDYDGWTVKAGKYLREKFFRDTREDVIREFERLMGKGSWRRYRRGSTHKIVKVKLVEVK